MKVFLQPTGLYSTAMLRVVNALTRFRPSSVEIVQDRTRADLRVWHMISYPETPEFADELLTQRGKHAFIQYCFLTTLHPRVDAWLSFWRAVRVVWSYYDLDGVIRRAGLDPVGCNLYDAPLGIDPAFVRQNTNGAARDIGLMTSGYVSHPCAEAIEEAALAALACGLSVKHLGPMDVRGMARPEGAWSAVQDCSDDELAQLYVQTRWVSGLRHGEGFELPVLEGLVCGARPVVFDRPDMRRWYDGHAEFVPESSGIELVGHLRELFSQPPRPVSTDERESVRQRFDWKPIVEGFWKRVLDA